MVNGNKFWYSSTGTPYILQVEMIVWYTAEAPVILSLPKSRELLRSPANGRMNLSAIELSSTYPQAFLQRGYLGKKASYLTLGISQLRFHC